jgi:hypothetical protein
VTDLVSRAGLATVIAIAGMIVGVLATEGRRSRADEPAFGGPGAEPAAGNIPRRHSGDSVSGAKLERLVAQAGPTSSPKAPTGKTLPKSGPGMSIGIVDRPGELAAREVFYEAKSGKAVFQGDIVIGAVEDLDDDLIDEIGDLVRQVDLRRDLKAKMSDDEKKALQLLLDLGDAQRAVGIDPALESLAQSVAQLPQDVGRALSEHPEVKKAIDHLASLKPATARSAEVEQSQPMSEHIQKKLLDPGYRDQLLAGLAAMAKRPGNGVRSAGAVGGSLDALQKFAKPRNIDVDLERLRALAARAPIDRLPISPEQKAQLRILGKKAAAADPKLNASPFLVQGSDEDSVRSVFMTYRRYRWPKVAGKVVVPYNFDSSMNDTVKSKIVDSAMKDYQDRTAITFKPRDDEADYVTFKITPGVNQSPVGRQGGQQFVELEENALIGTIIHEVGHSLGLWHEMSRSDRDDTIEVIDQNVMPQQLPNFKKTGAEGSIFGHYDIDSVMHYNARAFGQAGAITIQLKGGQPLPDSVGLLDDNKRLSDLDIRTGLDMMYGKKP